MAEIVCPKCKKSFNRNSPETFVTRAAAMMAGAAAGAWLGGALGIIGGPLTGTAFSIPGTVFGGIVAWRGSDLFRRCPHCSHVFKIRTP